MDSLKNISSDIIRKNWITYKDIILYTSDYYELLWKGLEDKFNIDNTNIFFILFKKFINNEELNCDKPIYDRIHINKENNETLVIKGMNGEERKDIHKLCDKIGLHHQSKPYHKKKYKKFLYIYKPKVWCFEYTEKNPYSESDEIYQKRELERKIKEEEIKERLSRKYCCICESNGYETELFRSVYIRGLYCNDCLEIESDGEGGILSNHKFEPI